ncbi:uncharacterized protein C9orf43 homolog isoform X1 [Sarcophilus harrisii]|uniref:uncharacterized protein C9orf43 homolog isoform X1 n=1 Tax=Sarcophilus harrisii TaxID=9305 RepID=UPI001301F2EE|nr:uncharacterized protein C9orf43 homolog isoform X1 [Sarcophilus harrisii]
MNICLLGWDERSALGKSRSLQCRGRDPLRAALSRPSQRASSRQLSGLAVLVVPGVLLYPDSQMANDLEVDFCSQPVINVRLPDLSQLDETTCSQLVCQHPHCWAAIRRLQRGHPRILQPISRAPKKSEDELPTLKIVDLSLPDSFILAKRISDSVPFFKHPPSLSGDSKVESDLQSSVEESFLGFRSLRDFHGKGFGQNRRKPAKLPVLNLNSTYIPKSPDGGNLVMVWIPDEPVKYKRPDQKRRTKLSPDKASIPLKNSKAISSLEGISKKAAHKKKKTTQVPTGGQPCSAQLIHRWLKVLPPSPVTMPSNMGSLSSWDFTFPKQLLMSSLSNEEKAIAKMNQLDVIDEESLFQKRHPFKLSKTKMILAVHRINLQDQLVFVKFGETHHQIVIRLVKFSVQGAVHGKNHGFFRSQDSSAEK